MELLRLSFFLKTFKLTFPSGRQVTVKELEDWEFVKFLHLENKN